MDKLSAHRPLALIRKPLTVVRRRHEPRHRPLPRAGRFPRPVTVEVHLSGGLPSTSIVGLPETAVQEARDRVRVVILNARLDYPGRCVTVNLAPADLPKDRGRFDMPTAIGILAASGHLPRDALQSGEFVGELALSGELRAVNGVLPALLRAQAAGRQAVVPLANVAEATLIDSADACVAGNVLDVCAHLSGVAELTRATVALAQTAAAADGTTRIGNAASAAGLSSFSSCDPRKRPATNQLIRQAS